MAADNGGATYAGVTAKEITLVFYRVKDSPAVQAVVGNAGIVPTTAQLKDFLAAETRFINSRYELWGRKRQDRLLPEPVLCRHAAQ